MPKKQFCDFCGADVTDEPSSAIDLIEDADADGNGEITDSWPLVCVKCFAKVQAFLQSFTGDTP